MVWSIRRIRFGIKTCLLEEHMCSHRMRVIELIRLEDFGYSLRIDRRSSSDPSGLKLRDSNRTRTKEQKCGLGQTWARCRSSRWDWFANSPDALASKVTPWRFPCVRPATPLHAPTFLHRLPSFSSTWFQPKSSLRFQDPVPSSTQTASGRASARPLKNGIDSAFSLIKSLYAPSFSAR
ncbi:hypothetical protein BJV77DRAFT_283088 [Russula vinacea]|nr:hypothetical protein BJV77DRAFT_283088 [Russula vinacea]